MPQASAFTNSVRAYTEGRNIKVENPSSLLNTNYLRALSCEKTVSWKSTIYKPACINGILILR